MKPRYLLTRRGAVLKNATPELMKARVKPEHRSTLADIRGECDYVLSFCVDQALRDSAAAWLREIASLEAAEVADAWVAVLRVRYDKTLASKQWPAAVKAALIPIAARYDVLLGRAIAERPSWYEDGFPPGDVPKDVNLALRRASYATPGRPRQIPASTPQGAPS